MQFQQRLTGAHAIASLDQQRNSDAVVDSIAELRAAGAEQVCSVSDRLCAQTGYIAVAVSFEADAGRSRRQERIIIHYTGITPMSFDHAPERLERPPRIKC